MPPRCPAIPQLSNGPSWVSAADLPPAPVSTRSVFLHHGRWIALRMALAALVLGLRLAVPLMLRGFVS
jgi:hypothetical protein